MGPWALGWYILHSEVGVRISEGQGELVTMRVDLDLVVLEQNTEQWLSH